MKNLFAVIEKEFIHIMRDRRTLGLIIFMPLLQLILYGYGINTDTKHLSTVVVNEDQTALSRRLIQSFEQSGYFNMNYWASSVDEVRNYIDNGKAKVGLRIPSHFAKDILAGRQAHLQILIDGTDSSPANTALNVGQAIVGAFIQNEGLSTATVSPIEVRSRLWYNPDLKSSYFMIPGLVGLLIQFLIPMISASAIVNEKERGTIEQLLVTPIKRWEFILGKLIPYVFIGLFIATMIITTSYFLFKVPIRGNVFLLLTLTLLFLIVCLGIGLLASTVAENQQQASQVVMFFASPSILLSGFIFPREQMPFIIYQIGNIFPLTHYLEIVRGIVLKGIGVEALVENILILIFMAVGIILLSILKFQKRVA